MSVINSRVVNIDELKLDHFVKGERFESNAHFTATEARRSCSSL